MFDYVIVGAGSAGCVLATRLSADPARSLLLLEAGPDYPDLAQLPAPLAQVADMSSTRPGHAHTWRTYGKANAWQPQPIFVPRGRVVGGSSAINGPIFRRGLPEDYDGWAALGNHAWSYAEVLPYFKRLESDLDFGADKHHGDQGPINVWRPDGERLAPYQKAFMRACRDAGLPWDADMNGPQGTGVGVLPVNSVDGIRSSTARQYLASARDRPNLTVWADAPVTRVRLDGGRVRGVELTRAGRVEFVEVEEVVLSAGAFGSPQLLMLSGLGPAEELTALGLPVLMDLPGVGRNLRDHPLFRVHFRAAHPLDLSPTAPRLGLRFTTPGSPFRNDVRIQFHPIKMALEPGSEPLDLFQLNCLLEAVAGEGRVTLASDDPRAEPQVDYRLLMDPTDRRRAVAGLRFVLDLVQHPALSRYVGSLLSPTAADMASDERLEAWLVANVGTGFHVVGTCKMGPPEDPLAVVDQFGRVRGVNGLRVVDASIMPTTIRANPNASTIMIAERISQAILEGTAAQS